MRFQFIYRLLHRGELYSGGLQGQGQRHQGQRRKVFTQASGTAAAILTTRLHVLTTRLLKLEMAWLRCRDFPREVIGCTRRHELTVSSFLFRLHEPLYMDRNRNMLIVFTSPLPRSISLTLLLDTPMEP